MKTGAVLGVAVAVIVLVVGGLLVYRSTAPNGDVVPEGTPSLEDATEPLEGQFLQLEPTSVPPGSTESQGGGTESTTVPLTAPGGAAGGAGSGQTVVISMTDAGFVPSTTTISVGTTVRFVNDGQALHWPASAVHPTHEVLPDFDSERGVATGDAYAHTFDKPGTWDFHDHLNPQFTGTVTVK